MPEQPTIADDPKPSIAEMIAKMAEEMKKWNTEIEYPVPISAVDVEISMASRNLKPGTPVAVRLAGSDDRTYFGIYLAEMPVSFADAVAIGLHVATHLLRVSSSSNPAMFVPDLGRVVWGLESWWTKIESEAHLRAITDDEISKALYVQLIKSLAARESKEQATPAEEPKA